MLGRQFGKDKSGIASTPVEQKININTASANIAAGLSLSKHDAEAITQYRTGKGELKEWPDLRKVPDIDVKKLEEQREIASG